MLRHPQDLWTLGSEGTKPLVEPRQEESRVKDLRLLGVGTPKSLDSKETLLKNNGLHGVYD